MIDEKRIADFFAELVFIDSPSLEECEMADTLKAKFAEIGVNFTEDHTQEQTGSNAGNLFARIPGSIDGAPVLFAAHMDTVEPAKGKKAVFHDDGTVTSDGTTVLGADDLAGVTAIYEAVRHITEAGAPHSPIEILISTGEELYCKGANAFDYSQVQAKEAYVLDLSGAIGAAAYAAPTLVSFKAEIQGKAAHAGFHPEDGINSIQAAARAVAQLPQEPDIFLNDAVIIPGISEEKQIKIIKGDAKSVSIAAASILAKVTRDHMMMEYDKIYPEYGFAKHKGYGTKMHNEAILTYGPCPIHRRTFLKKLLGEEAAMQGMK